MTSQHLSQDRLVDYQIGVLDEPLRLATDAHLAECEACRERLADLRLRLAHLELLREDPTPPEPLVAAAIAAASRPRRALRILPLLVGAAAAALVLALVLRQFLAPASAPPPPAYGISPDAKPPFAPASNIELNVLPRRDDVQLTIYNAADLTLVRETRQLTMKQGWNWLQFMWANTLIDPTSLELLPQDGEGRVEVRQLVYPPRLPGVGRWLMYSHVSGQVPFNVTYFTSGLRWNAVYFATLSQDESHLQLDGHVRVTNGSGEEYDNAQVRLVVGEVRLKEQIAQLAQRQPAYGSPLDSVPVSRRPPVSDWPYALFIDGHVEDYRDHDRQKAFPREILKEGLSEYFLYTIEGRDTIPDGWGKRLPSFSVADIPVRNLYKHDPDRWGDATMRFLYFANDSDHNLGQTPLPEGQTRIFRRVDQPAPDHLTYEGRADLKYIPVDDKVELELGPAKKVSVERLLMDQRSENYRFDRGGNIAGWDEVKSWKLTLGNRRGLPVRLESTFNIGTPHWQIETASINPVKHDASHLRWTLDVSPQSETIITCTLRTYHGINAENR